MSYSKQDYLDRIEAALGGNQERVNKDKAPKQTRAANFSTKACIAWGRAQGWKLLDRERWDDRTKRHHDLPLGADAMFDSPNGIVYVQGAGRSERKVHRERFEAGGGATRCTRMRVQFVYVEFVRDVPEPVLVEWWAA